MGVEKDVIVAVELGSTIIRAIAGKRQLDGAMQVLAYAEERSANTIRKGVIDNIDKTTQAIASVVRQLSEKLDMRIVRVYVGIAGQSLHTERNVVPRMFAEKIKITNELIDEMKDTNQGVVYPNSRILEVVPQEYRIGNRSVDDPVGLQSEQIEAVFLNVVARKELYESIETCVRNAGVELADILIAPLCLADSQLPRDERRSGCALVNIGAETTTVVVYKNGIMRHLAVIPLGGANVTADISTIVNMERDEAERLKLKYGTAFYVSEEKEARQEVAISFSRKVSESALKQYAAARYEEIICNVGEQLNGQDDLICGVALTGGGALAADIITAFAEYIKWDANKIHLRKGLPSDVELASGMTLPDVNLLHTVIALLQKGDQNCVEELIAEFPEETPIAVENPAESTASEDPATTSASQEPEEEVAEAEEVVEPREPKQNPAEKIKGTGRSLWQRIKEALTEE